MDNLYAVPSERLSMLWSNDNKKIGIATESKENILSGIDFSYEESDETKIFSFKEALRRLCNADEELLSGLFMEEQKFNKLNLTGKYLIKNKKLFITKEVVKKFHKEFEEDIKNFENSFVKEEPAKFKFDILNKLYSIIRLDEEEYDEDEEDVIIEETDSPNKKDDMVEIFKNAFNKINLLLNRKMDEKQREFLDKVEEGKLIKYNRLSSGYYKAVEDIDNFFELLETSGLFSDSINEKIIERMAAEVDNYVVNLSTE